MIESFVKAVAETVKEGAKEMGKGGFKDKIPDFTKPNDGGMGGFKDKIPDCSKNEIKEKDEMGKTPDFSKLSSFINSDGILRNTPNTDGHWEGEKGDSKWYPDRDKIPEGRGSNPDGETWGKILDKHGIDGIDFIDGEPDFSEIAEETVEIDNMIEDRYSNKAKDIIGNYEQADEKLAEQWNETGKKGGPWTAGDVADYREQNNLTWHEKSDMKTMELVPTDIHANIPHSGGVSKIKQVNT